MYCVKKMTEDLYWVGASERRLNLFENAYPLTNGVSYNSYLLLDEKTVLIDTVDKSVSGLYFENVEHVLSGRKLDYLIVQHMEPDHSATLAELLRRCPETTVVCNKMIADMIKQFFNLDITPRALIVKEGDTLSTGRHNLTFIAAPMVHWPEVMVTYDTVDKILFSADAFGTFGALNGAIFADEVDFDRDYMDEARRYYTNIVGKYGAQVQSLLKKASGIEISLICPLHGFVWRRNLDSFISKYLLWSSYTPEESGVVIAYASIYGNTANAAEVLSAYLFDRGVRTVVYDVSVTPASDIIAACFRFSHIVFAAPTYNSGIFVTMEAFLHDLAAHSLQNRTVAFIQNGSWAPTSGKQMRAIIEPLRNLFKDEVRKAGLELGIPDYLVFRQPFPGPGLGIRIIGDVTAEKVQMVQDADAIWREEIAKAGLDKEVNQYFAALTNMRSVGVMGDERTYDYAIALRAVTTTDFMTAESAEIPWDVIGRTTSRIVNEVKHVNRVMYDCTGKPPATIEFE